MQMRMLIRRVLCVEDKLLDVVVRAKDNGVVARTAQNKHADRLAVAGCDVREDFDSVFFFGGVFA